uniref:Uncharacterized protein n=1 Tax=Hyaloperonospora arabidopsidis (strain Emoy2) TaxID=559515 RepID=M4BQ45_HYAAE
MDMSGMNLTASPPMGMTNPSIASPPMGMTNPSTASPGKDFRCPVCGMSTTAMGYNNLNHVGLVNGQIVYTCGMPLRPFEDYETVHTDTSYLAANMAEFIVNATDATVFAECEDSCSECADGIKDPITGDDVTTSNYHYVCLVNGQKIYFASGTSKNEYLGNVSSQPRFVVDNIICENMTCSDAETITVLSAAAQAFVPDLSSSDHNASGAMPNGSAPTSDDPATANAAMSVNSPVGLTLAVASVLVALAAVM